MCDSIRMKACVRMYVCVCKDEFMNVCMYLCMYYMYVICRCDNLCVICVIIIRMKACVRMHVSVSMYLCMYVCMYYMYELYVCMCASHACLFVRTAWLRTYASTHVWHAYVCLCAHYTGTYHTCLVYSPWSTSGAIVYTVPTRSFIGMPSWNRADMPKSIN